MANHYLAADAAEIQTDRPAYPQRIREILAEVAYKHGLTVGEVVGPRRLRKHALARFEAAWRMRQPTDYGHVASFPQIGRWLDRDHTSIMHMVRRHEAVLVDQIEAPVTLGFVP